MECSGDIRGKGLLAERMQAFVRCGFRCGNFGLSGCEVAAKMPVMPMSQLYIQYFWQGLPAGCGEMFF